MQSVHNGVKYNCVQCDYKATLKQVFNNMCDLFILEFNIFVRNVVIRQLGKKASTACAICSQWS